MANSHANTGAVAAKAGASTDGPAAKVEATNSAEGVGKADIAGDAPKDAVADVSKTDDNGSKEAAKVVEKAAEAIKTVVKEAEKVEKPKNLKKVKILRSHPEFAYHPGEEGELPAEKAALLIEGGFAEAVTK